MITLQNASRWYGEVMGLNDVTCEITPGLTALLGMNGAGKSTMLRLITGQLRPTTGSIKVFGEEPFSNPEIYRRFGYCPEIDNFYEHMSGRQFVYHLARLAGYGHAVAKSKTEEKLEMVGMADRADKQIKGYSKGMRQRIKLAQAMVHNPDIILLDEPLNGLDPVGRRSYIDILSYLAQQGKCVVVSSHILYEVESMTNSIVLLQRGRLLAHGDLSLIRALIDKHPHQVRIETPEPKQLARHLAGLENVVSIEFDPYGKALVLEVREVDSFFDFLAATILDHKIPVTSFSSPDNNLESVFKYLVGA